MELWLDVQPILQDGERCDRFAAPCQQLAVHILTPLVHPIAVSQVSEPVFKLAMDAIF